LEVFNTFNSKATHLKDSVKSEYERRR